MIHLITMVLMQHLTYIENRIKFIFQDVYQLGKNRQYVIRRGRDETVHMIVQVVLFFVPAGFFAVIYQKPQQNYR